MTLKVNSYIFGLTKCTICCKNVPVFVPVFLYAFTLLIFQIKRIFQVKNGLTTLLLFFFENAENLVSRTTLNGEKKEDGLKKKRDRMDKTLPQRRFTLWLYTQ